MHEAGPVVLEYRQRLSHWAQNPRAALAFDGTSMDLVRNGPFLPHVLQRLRVIFERMSKRWVHYTREYEVGGTLHATSTPDADVLRVLPATSCFEESFFGVLSSALKSGGNRAAPWRVSALAVAKHNAPYTTPLPNEDCKLVMSLARDVEQQHGGSCKRLRQQLSSTEPTEALTRYHKRVRQDEAFVNASKRTKANSTPSTEPPQQRRSGRKIVTPARFLD